MSEDEITSIWLKIGEGPLLEAAATALAALRHQDALRGRYRIGDQRRNGREREVEIVFDDTEHAFLGKCAAP